tara:strand:- start:17659 stop:18873 length:1215 start_codon:yes stop_codon:yes gene_type:complete
MLDIVIIGGGIGGINSALFLSKKNKTLLLDERSYWGGRLITNKQPHYEMGAARFNNNHKLLNKLIDKYKLTKIKLPQSIDYLDIHKELYIKDVHKLLDYYFENLVELSKKYKYQELKKMTLFEFMNKCNNIECSEKIVSIFGYYSEIKAMNAYDALRSFGEDFVNVKYFILKDGLSKLCTKMIEEIKKQGGICKTDSFVKDVKKEDKHFLVKTQGETYKCKKVVFAIKAHQLKSFKLLSPVHKYIESVHDSELLRIYAKYPVRKNGPWFSKLRRMTTNSFLRQIIPIDYSTGLIMISYTDGEDISVYKDKKDKLLKETKIKQLIQTELSKIFKHINIPQPTYFKTHYWNIGAHHWKPNYDSNVISKKMLNPMKNIYICGESFSKKQAWIEGALETSMQVINLIH